MVKTKRSKVLKEYYAALGDRTAHPRFISSDVVLVLARAELEKYLTVPWHKRVWREFVTREQERNLKSSSLSSR